MKRMSDKKTLLCLDEYRKGFQELEQLVNGFEEMTVSSQVIFLDAREHMLVMQLKSVNEQRDKVLDEAKKFLAHVNSKLSYLSESEELAKVQLSECRELKKVIIETTKEETDTNEKAAI